MWLSGKESACQCRRRRFDPWVRKIPWRRAWQPTPVFVPGESHGQRNLVCYLQSIGSRRVRHDSVTRHTHTGSVSIILSSSSCLRKIMRASKLPFFSSCIQEENSWISVLRGRLLIQKSKPIGLNIVTVFSESTVGKESTCNAGDPSLIPRSGR